MKKLDDFVKQIGSEIIYDEYPGGFYAILSRAEVFSFAFCAGAVGSGVSKEAAVFNLCGRISGKNIEMYKGETYKAPIFSFEDFIGE